MTIIRATGIVAMTKLSSNAAGHASDRTPQVDSLQQATSKSAALLAVLRLRWADGHDHMAWLATIDCVRLLESGEHRYLAEGTYLDRLGLGRLRHDACPNASGYY